MSIDTLTVSTPHFPLWRSPRTVTGWLVACSSVRQQSWSEAWAAPQSAARDAHYGHDKTTSNQDPLCSAARSVRDITHTLFVTCVSSDGSEARGPGPCLTLMASWRWQSPARGGWWPHTWAVVAQLCGQWHVIRCQGTMVARDNVTGWQTKTVRGSDVTSQCHFTVFTTTVITAETCQPI